MSPGHLGMQIVMERQGKLLLTTWFSLALIVGCAAALLYKNEADTRINSILAEERYRLSFDKAVIEHKIDNITKDLDFLANSASIIRASTQPSEENMEFAAQNLIAFSRSKQLFDQVRWISEEGVEKVRVNYNDGEPAAVSSEKLQDKSDRYYVRESLKLTAGKYYVSPLELAIENEKIEIPHKPTLRFGQRIILPSGRTDGIMLLNYNCSSLLENFIATMGEAKHRSYLLNNEGYWLYSPEKQDEWGFMLNKPTTFKYKFGTLWDQIASIDQGQVDIQGRTWSWTTIWPTSTIENNNSFGTTRTSRTTTPFRPDYQWKIVSYLDEAMISTRLRSQQINFIAGSLIAFILLSIIGWLFVRMNENRQNARLAMANRIAMENDERFNLLIQSSPNGLLLVSKSGEILRANPQALTMFESSPEELIGRSVDILVPESIYDTHVHQRNTYISKPTARKLGSGKDLSARKKNGVEFAAEISLTPLKINGELFVLACVVDISERKAAEIVQSRLAAIVEGSEDAIISKTLDGIVMTWNKGAELLFGYSAAEMIGKEMILAIPEELKTQEQDIIRNISHGQTVSHVETRRLRKDGTIFEASVTISPITDIHHKIIGASAITRNITEQKKAQREIKRLNENLEKQVEERTHQLDRALRDLQNILDALPSMVGYWDKNLENRFANRAYAEWFGIDPKEIPGRHIRDIIGELRYAENKEHMQAALEGQPQLFERAYPSADGTYLMHSLAHYIPDIHNDEVQGFYVLVHDITRMKQTEAALRAANQELEAFAYAVSHDLRAPVRAMIGFSQALREDCGNQLSEAGQDYLAEVEKAGKKMGELIEGLLILSRSTKGEIERENVDLSELSQKILTDLQQSDNDAPSTFKFEVEPGLVTHCDARMADIVLRNLFSNAVKYCSKTADPCIKFYSSVFNGERNFCVQDNGAGFDMLHADRLFKPFQRLHRQDEFKGIGIGLATVKRIVHRHGGNISARSEPNKGAIFCFNFGTTEPAKDAHT